MALSMIDPRQMTDEQRNLVLGKILPDSVPPTQPANTAPQPGPLTPVEPAKPKEGALSPVDQRMQHDTQKLQDLQNYKHLGEQGSTHPGTLGKVGHVFSTIGNTLGNIFAPGVMEMTPGTTAHRYAQIGQLKNDIAGEQQQKLEGAEADKNEATAEAMRDPGAKLHPLEQAQQAVADEAKRQGKNPMEILDMLRAKAQSEQPDVVHAYSAALASGNTEEAARLAPLVKQFVENSHAGADKQPSRDDKNIAIMQADFKAKNPGLTDDQAYKMAYDKWVKDTKVNPGVLRMEVLNQRSQFPAIDTQNDNSLRFVNANDLNASNAKDPGRYVPAGQGATALNKTALIEDIRGNINSLRETLKDPNLQPFSAGQRAKLAIVLSGGDKGAIDAMTTGAFMEALSPQQQDYVIRLTQLVENSMAMRSVLGAGQGSDQLREAIRRTVPTAANPTAQYGLKQVDAVEQVLNRLERGVPSVPLRNDVGGAGAAPQRPANVPAGYVFQENGPHGRGWYRPNAAQR